MYDHAKARSLWVPLHHRKTHTSNPKDPNSAQHGSHKSQLGLESLSSSPELRIPIDPVMLHHINTLPCCNLLYSTLLYSTLLYSDSTLLYSTLLYSDSTLLYSTLLDSTLLRLYSTLLYSTRLYSTQTLLYSTLLYSTLLY